MSEDLLVVNAKPVKQFSVLILDIRVYFMWNCQRQSCLALNISFAEKLTVLSCYYLANIFYSSNEINPPGGEV